MSSYINPTISDFQARFVRDFPYGNADLTTVNDTDINQGLIQQQLSINPQLFNSQAAYTQGSLLLAAHFLVQNLRASSQGIAGKWDWVTQSKTVGSVNSSFAIPDRILENPELAMYASTTYGVMYLQMIMALLTGQMFSVAGGTIGIGMGAGIFTGPYGRIGPWNGSGNL